MSLAEVFLFVKFHDLFVFAFLKGSKIYIYQISPICLGVEFDLLPRQSKLVSIRQTTPTPQTHLTA